MALNNTQRKVLEKLYVRRIEQAREEWAANNNQWSLRDKVQEEMFSHLKADERFQRVEASMEELHELVASVNAQWGVEAEGVKITLPYQYLHRELKLEFVSGSDYEKEFKARLAEREAAVVARRAEFEDAKSRVSEAVWLYEGVEVELAEKLDSILSALKEG